jgi:hypothetical protein|tara:strand:+ start:369 stop:1274 length:906 start_codon:yes stop_codon:yes gene_type:complete
MPQNYTRTVNWTGANTGAGPNYTWVEVSNSQAGWVSYVEDPNNADAWIFQIADNTAGNAVNRAATFRVQHHTYSDGSDANTFDEFTITQYTTGTVEVTSATNATIAPTNATNATDAPTNATNATDAPTNATNATDAPTNATNATDAPTDATNATTIFSSIAWDNSTLNGNNLGEAKIELVTKEVGSGNGVGTLPNYDDSGGQSNLTQANAIYWADSLGNTVEAEPSWILGVDANDAWGSGSGITDDNKLRVVITLDSYPASGGGTNATNATIQPTLGGGGSGSGGGGGGGGEAPEGISDAN